MIGYYTKFTTAADSRNALVELLTQASEAMDGVAGCMAYEVSLSADDPAITVVMEMWKDEAAHDASLLSEEAKALIEQAQPLIVGTPQQAKFGPVISSWVAE